VLERRPGRPIGELGAQAPGRDPGEATWIAAQVLQGLAELAEHGWIHGDLGPSNLLLEGSRASLLDLGLARASADRESRRSGTFHVMPPEILAQGLPHPRSDMFSLGALLFQALTGLAPFPEDPEAALPLILAGRPLPAAAATGHPLLPLALRCLSADPARRPSAREALDSLLPALPGARAALLLPRRGPGAWDPTLLGVALDRLRQQSLVVIRSGAAGQWRPRLDQLLLEAAGRSPFLEVDRGHGQALLDWLALRADQPGQLGRHPELSRALSRRQGGPEVLRQILGFLDDQLERPRQGICWISGPQDPDAGLLRDLAAACRRQERPLIVLLLEGAADGGLEEVAGGALRLEPAHAGDWAGWLRHPAPGLELDEAAAAALDPLAGGDSERIAPLVARCLSEGSLALDGGLWRLTGTRLPRGESRRAEDLALLEPDRRQALTRACAWVEPAPAGAWRALVWQGREGELEALEGSGWLRDRGDGQLEARAGLPQVLGEDALRRATLDLLHDHCRQESPSAEWGLLLLSRAGLQGADPDMARGILLGARGLVNPGRKLQLIAELLPALPPARRPELEGALAAALVEQGRPAEAAVVLKRLLRGPAQGAAALTPESGGLTLLLKLTHAWGLCRRPRLALRLLEHARPRVPEGEGRLAVDIQSLEHLQAAGLAAAARARLEAAQDDLSACDPGTPGVAHTLNGAAAAAFRLGLYDLATRLWTQLNRAGRSALQVQQRVWLSNNLGVIHLQAGRLEQARAELEQAGREAALFHLDRYELMARVNLAVVQLRRGAADQAVRELEPALVQARELGAADTELAVLDHLGEAWAALGDYEHAERHWERELALARALDRPEEGLEPLKHLLCLDWDLGLAPSAARLERFRELEGHHCEAGRPWALLEAYAERGVPGRQLPPGAPAALRALAAGREVQPAELLEALMGLEPRLDGVRLALAILAEHLAWLGDWAPVLREVREAHRLHEIRLLHLEGELAARREDWINAGMRLGRAVHLLEAVATDLSPAWQERLAASPWLKSLAARAGDCLSQLNLMERRDHGHAAGTVGRAAGA